MESSQALLESQEILETRVTGYNQGGLTVAFGRLRGFVPNSHLSMVPRNATAEQQQQILSGPSTRPSRYAPSRCSANGAGSCSPNVWPNAAGENNSATTSSATCRSGTGLPDACAALPTSAFSLTLAAPMG
ncbi:MAG: S1 RNA-binding domain-containing protein [Anaerolineae bacterium]|nr:MAG: S1 RNA-binding domain-containing protein [Anaerolineae bacterium]